MKRLFAFTITLALLLASCTPQIANLSEFVRQPLTEVVREPALSAGQKLPILPAPASIKETAEGKCSQGDLGSSLLFWVPTGRKWALTPLDPATGLPLCAPEPIHFGEVYFQAISPDRSLLALLDYQMPTESIGQLKFVDLRSWQVISTTIQIEGWINAISFDPTGSKLAIAYNQIDGNDKITGHALMQIDVAQPSSAQQADAAILTSFLAYTADGSKLVIYGAPIDQATGTSQMPVRALVYSTSDLKLVWDASIPGLSDGTFQTGKSNELMDYIQWRPAVALDPVQARLYVAHADQEALTTVDLNRQTVATVAISAKQSWFERLLAATAGVAHAKIMRGTIKEGVLSPDGSRLYVAGYSGDPTQDKNGNWEFNMVPLDMQVIDPSTGHEIQQVATAASQVEAIPGLSMLLLRGWDMDNSWTEILDTDTLAVTQRLPDQMVQVASLVNGDLLLISTIQDTYSSQVTVLDPVSFEIGYEYRAKGYYIDLD